MSRSSDLLYKKLHKLSPVFMLTDTIKEFFIIIVLAVFASTRAESWQLWAIGASSFFVLFRMVAIRFFSYAIAEDELIVKQGILFRQERHVPFERVQNINETQGILHRFFKVSKVTLESASGQTPEAVFNVISKEALQEIRAAVKQKATVENLQFEQVESPIKVNATQQLLFLPAGEVMKHGLVTLQGMIPLAIGIGFLAQQDGLWDKFFGQALSKLPGSDNINSEMLAQAPGIVIASLLGLALFAIICFGALSILHSLLKFYDFTLKREGEKLLAQRGLLTKLSSSTSIQRIQKINIHQGILHRLFRRVTVSCKTAGNAMAAADGIAKFDVLAPLLDKQNSHTLLRSIFPELNWKFLNENDPMWQKIPYRSWRRMVKWKLFFFGVISLVLAFWIKLWALALFIPAAIWSVYDAQREAKAAAFIYTDDYVVYRSGWLSKDLSIVPMQKGQAADLKQNIFDKRHKMAAFELDTAGVSFFDHGIDIPYLEFDDALQLQKNIIRRTNELEFEW